MNALITDMLVRWLEINKDPVMDFREKGACNRRQKTHGGLVK
jgi:hypothetical protein